MSDVFISTCSGRKLKMVVEDNGDIKVEEYLEAGQRHATSGSLVREQGFYILWQQVLGRK